MPLAEGVGGGGGQPQNIFQRLALPALLATERQALHSGRPPKAHDKFQLTVAIDVAEQAIGDAGVLPCLGNASRRFPIGVKHKQPLDAVGGSSVPAGAGGVGAGAQETHHRFRWPFGQIEFVPGSNIARRRVKFDDGAPAIERQDACLAVAVGDGQ